MRSLASCTRDESGCIAPCEDEHNTRKHMRTVRVDVKVARDGKKVAFFLSHTQSAMAREEEKRVEREREKKK